MSKWERRLHALEVVQDASTVRRIRQFDAKQAMRELDRLQSQQDAPGMCRLIRNLPSVTLNALASSISSPWLALLPDSDLLALRDGERVVGPLPPGVAYQ